MGCLQFSAGNLADCSSHWQHHQLALHTFFDDDDDDDGDDDDIYIMMKCLCVCL